MNTNSAYERPWRVMYIEHNAQRGGSVYSLRDLVINLGEGITPTICEFSDVEFKGLFEELNIEVITIPYKVFNFDRGNSGLYRGRLGRELLVLERWTTYTAPLVFFLYRLFRRHKPTLIHVNDHVFYNRAEILAAALAKIPCVCHLREIRNRLSPVELRAAQSVSRFIAISEVVKDSAVESGLPAERIRVVYNGISFPVQASSTVDRVSLRRRLGLVPEGAYVITHGRLVDWKGIDRAIAVWPDILSSYPGARLLILGDGPERSRLEQLVEANRLSGTVTFVGFVSGIWDYLFASDVYIHCVTSPEPFGRSLAEAMGAGLAVVAPRWGSSEELVQSQVSALLYEPLDNDDLKRNILKLLGDADLRNRLGATAEQQARTRFSVENYAQGVQEVYCEVFSP